MLLPYPFPAFSPVSSLALVQVGRQVGIDEMVRVGKFRKKRKRGKMRNERKGLHRAIILAIVVTTEPQPQSL